jgi:hypothetical protein
MNNGSALAGFLLLFGAMTASPASAQMPSAAGAYERMTPDNQKVARALFEAQAVLVAPAPAGTRKNRALSLDEIAAQKRPGRGWGQVFQLMRAQGLLHETSLGQVVSRHEDQRSRARMATAARDTRQTTRSPLELTEK